jgi:peptidyl-prolyl cis-trans isomerase A (cyclophilin A)
MTAFRRLALFMVVLSIVTTTACVPLNRANARTMAVRDSLAAARDSIAATRDSLALTRAGLARMDSVFMPAEFSTPDSFVVAFETTRGRFDVMAHSQWAPAGTDRFYELVHRRFYDSVYVFRVVKGFVAQFGISGDPAVSSAWRRRRLADEPVRESNTRGRLSFARSGPGTRTTQIYVNYGNNARLDTANTYGFPPFAEVVTGMEVVDSFFNEYVGSKGPIQDSISRLGNDYLQRNFPKLDMVRTARIIQEWRRPPR